MRLIRYQVLTIRFKKTERTNPITIIRDSKPGFTGFRIQSIRMANRKQTLQIKADRLSILNRPIVQKSKILHKIPLFCGINHFDLYECIFSEKSVSAYCCHSPVSARFHRVQQDRAGRQSALSVRCDRIHSDGKAIKQFQRKTWSLSFMARKYVQRDAGV